MSNPNSHCPGCARPVKIVEFDELQWDGKHAIPSGVGEFYCVDGVFWCALCLVKGKYERQQRKADHA